MFTDSHGETTGTNAWGYEVVVDKDGYVIEVGNNDSAIPNGGFVLSGHGTGKTTLEAAAEIGMKVTVASDKKSAVLAFEGQSAVVALETQFDIFCAQKDQAIASWRLLDETALASAQDGLLALCNSMKNAIENEDYVQYAIIDRTFAKALTKANELLVEEKAVEDEQSKAEEPKETPKKQSTQSHKAKYAKYPKSKKSGAKKSPTKRKK
jgi:hypothetical protein